MPQPVRATPSPTFLKLQAILSEITGVDPEDITPGMDFSELQMSPVDLSTFFSQAKQVFPLSLSSRDLLEYPSIGELAEYIEDELE